MLAGTEAAARARPDTHFSVELRVTIYTDKRLVGPDVGAVPSCSLDSVRQCPSLFPARKFGTAV